SPFAMGDCLYHPRSSYLFSHADLGYLSFNAVAIPLKTGHNFLCIIKVYLMTPRKISHSEYELHHHRLLLRRQTERRDGIILIVTGIVYFLLTLICSLPLFFLHTL